jgi:hypothetical protein
MRSFRSVALALAFAAGPASIAAAQSPTPQPLKYWHVWVDSTGTTHQTQCEFKDFSPLSLGKGVEPIFVDKLPDKPAHVVIAQFPQLGRPGAQVFRFLVLACAVQKAAFFPVGCKPLSLSRTENR